MNAEEAADSSERLLHEQLTYTVIGRAFRVHNKLGFGFVENVYLGALQHELRKAGLHAEREVPIAVWYDEVIVGTYRVDLFVERKIIVEVKACELHSNHQVQLLNYLRSTDIEVGMLIYFGRKVSHKRLIFRNSLKTDVYQRM
jgi:GxxExxY protein